MAAVRVLVRVDNRPRRFDMELGGMCPGSRDFENRPDSQMLIGH